MLKTKPKLYTGFQRSVFIDKIWGESCLFPRYHFLTVSPSFLHFLPSLITNVLNLPFRTQGRSGRLKFFSSELKMVDTEGFLYLGGSHSV